MLKKKSTSREKKRKHSQSEEQHANRKRRSTESSVEDELDRIGSDIEEGGLDLNTPFQPISAFMSDRREMLEQCFHVLGKQKLQKMLPDELKSCSLEEIKTLCWSQLEQVSERNLLQILGGEELTSGDTGDNKEVNLESQQDNIVDSTSSLRDAAKSEDNKQEAVSGSGDESDVLSINADASDSDMELPKDDPAAKSQEGAAATSAADAQTTANPEPAKGGAAPMETRKELQKDIDRSVNEILASAAGTEDKAAAPPSTTATCLPTATSLVPVICQPSVQQLELLELEMRARAIKALMKAGDVKKSVPGPGGSKE